jgi:hypothetical protein
MRHRLAADDLGCRDRLELQTTRLGRVRRLNPQPVARGISRRFAEFDGATAERYAA